MNVLSIDWDYFFPDSLNYDWGANEESFLMYEFIWSIRYNAINLISKEVAHESYVVNNERLKEFKKQKWKAKKSVIVDSHKDIFSVLDKDSIVWNFDAHHDAGYHKKEVLDCGNWVERGRVKGVIKEYNLVYPPWRKKGKEPKPICRLDKTYYVPPTIPISFDLVFLCRSSCWTPPWADAAFLAFSMWIQQRSKEHFGADYVFKIRGLNNGLINQLEEQWKGAEALELIERNKSFSVVT